MKKARRYEKPRLYAKKQTGSLAIHFVEALLPASAGAGSPLLYRGFFQKNPALKLPLLLVGLGCSATAFYLAWTRPKMYTADQWIEQARLAQSQPPREPSA